MTPKRFLSTLCLTVLTLVAMAQPRAKYVFYFIGDGMGVNQVNAAETFLAAREGRIWGSSPLILPPAVLPTRPQRARP